MNHKWNKETNECTVCGLHRERKEHKKFQRTYSKLINGIFEDIPIYIYNFNWWYGEKNKFIRPDCKKQNLK